VPHCILSTTTSAIVKTEEIMKGTRRMDRGYTLNVINN
jgi:hypothetical protein